MSVKATIGRLFYKHTGLFAPTYDYALHPIQLTTIINNIQRCCAHLNNFNIVEIGVARGETTRFICEHLRYVSGSPTFYAIDTFKSYTEKDIDYERKSYRASQKALMKYNYLDYARWKFNFRKFDYLKAIKADVSEFDFSRIAPISVAIVDVNLYLPTINALNGLMENMVTEFAIIVDDVHNKCDPNGSYHAFNDFVKQNHHLNHFQRGIKCGVIVNN